MTAESNKNIVGRALAGFVETGDATALGAFLSDDFVHHRPGSPGRAKAGWLADLRAAQGPLAGMVVRVEHLLADGDHVMVRSRRHLPGGGPEVTVVDICRLAGGRIAEIWETIEVTARAAENLRWWEPVPH